MRDGKFEEKGKEALLAHVRRLAEDARERHGPLSPETLARILEDRRVVRYRTALRFDEEGLREGEFAWLEALGEDPSEGFLLHIHPAFEDRPDLNPLLAVYYVPSIDYGDVATHVEAETFGSILADLDRDAYYAILCEAADSLGQ